jgi:hypothetical protein
MLDEITSTQAATPRREALLKQLAAGSVTKL